MNALIAEQEGLQVRVDSLTGAAADQDTARVRAVQDLDALRRDAKVVPMPPATLKLVRGLEAALALTDVSLNTCRVTGRL